MRNKAEYTGRRNFIRSVAAITTGISGIALFPYTGSAIGNSAADDINIVGPKEGYSPQVGTLVSMMNWMRATVLRSVTGLQQNELDYLHDSRSNTIGSMLLHLAATEVFYQGNTFEGRKDFSDNDRKKWGIAMSLGEPARKQIKGNDLKFYLDMLEETRMASLTEFKKRDDKWLMEIDPSFFGRQPTNNYCKWFHVCEHESNHNGQIKWIRSRLPGAREND